MRQLNENKNNYNFSHFIPKLDFYYSPQAAKQAAVQKLLMWSVCHLDLILGNTLREPHFQSETEYKAKQSGTHTQDSHLSWKNLKMNDTFPSLGKYMENQEKIVKSLGKS